MTCREWWQNNWFIRAILISRTHDSYFLLPEIRRDHHTLSTNELLDMSHPNISSKYLIQIIHPNPSSISLIQISGRGSSLAFLKASHWRQQDQSSVQAFPPLIIIIVVLNIVVIIVMVIFISRNWNHAQGSRCTPLWLTGTPRMGAKESESLGLEALDRWGWVGQILLNGNYKFKKYECNFVEFEKKYKYIIQFWTKHWDCRAWIDLWGWHF